MSGLRIAMLDREGSARRRIGGALGKDCCMAILTSSSLLLIPAIRRASISATPGVTNPDETIEGFPEFAYTLDTIKDPKLDAKLHALARRIVQSHQTSRRIIGFEVHGHADVTLRLPPGPERDQTEMEVSVDRAENAKERLLQLIKEEGGTPIIAGIQANATAKGFGSKFNKFKPANTEAQRQVNRRVEIFLKTFDPPPPHPEPEPPPVPPKPEVGSNWSIQIKSGTVATLSLPNVDVVPAQIFLKVDIIDRDRKLKARFHVSAQGIALPGATMGPPTPLQTSFVPEGSVAQFQSTGGVTLKTFEGDVTVAQNPGAGGFLVSKGGAFVFNFEALEPTLTRPRAVEADTGSFPGPAVPQASGGIATGRGSITMQGDPVPIP